MSKSKVTLMQHPVGQGGMASGFIQSEVGRYQWIYDCGSNQTDALSREIDLIAARSAIVDCLFLSHLDSDHVSGLDQLFSRVEVKEVVLPYLNDTDRLIAAAHDDATGSLTGGFLTFLADPESWFSTRGVEQITYIVPNDDDGNPDLEPRFPNSNERGNRDGSASTWLSRLHTGIVNTSKETSGALARTLETGASLQLNMLDTIWLLVPYAHRPSEKALKLFRDEFDKKFSTPLDVPSFIATLLAQPANRSHLRDCYDLIWSDHNLVSMALYAGPVTDMSYSVILNKGRSICSCECEYCYCGNRSDFAGWLGTGDMHLNVKRRLKAFLKYYKKLLDKVAVFGLPHHGSKLNFDATLISAMPNASWNVAASGPNSYGHPSPSVKSAVIANGRQFVIVGDKPQSRFISRIFL